MGRQGWGWAGGGWGGRQNSRVGQVGVDPPKRGGPNLRKGFILFDIYIPPHVSLRTYTLFFLIYVYIYRLAMGKECIYD